MQKQTAEISVVRTVMHCVHSKLVLYEEKLKKFNMTRTKIVLSIILWLVFFSTLIAEKEFGPLSRAAFFIAFVGPSLIRFFIQMSPK
jgi:hypothetical protein